MAETSEEMAEALAEMAEALAEGTEALLPQWTSHKEGEKKKESEGNNF